MGRAASSAISRDLAQQFTHASRCPTIPSYICPTLFEADMPTSVRLDIKTEQTLARLARKKGTSKSAVLREAVDCLARQALHAQASGGLFARAEDLLGCVSGGAADLSTRTGAGFRRLLAQKGSSEKPGGLPG